MRTIGVLVVHGIGEQKPGETIQKVLNGLRFAAKESGATMIEGEDSTDPNRVRIEIEGYGTEIRLYEVYWAKIMDKATTDGAFDARMLSAVAWYPLLNRKYVRGYRDQISSKKSILWSTTAVFLAALISLGYYALNYVVRFVQGMTTSGPALLPARTWLDRKLDRRAGDIFTYVQSAGGLYPSNNPRAFVASDIHEIFERQLHRAAQCCDEVHVLAHSLGTLIAHHALSSAAPFLSRVLGDKGAEAYARVTVLNTLGSPLEKIRLIWPLVLNDSFRGGQPPGGFKWVNFHNPLDPVSEPLTSFDQWTAVKNRRVYSGGIASAHVIYESNPVVLSILMEQLCGKPLRFQSAWRRKWWRNLRGVTLSLFETTVVVGFVSFFAIVGLLMYAGATWVMSYAVGFLTGLFFTEAVAEYVRLISWVVLFLLVIIGVMLEGINRQNRGDYNKWVALAVAEIMDYGEGVPDSRDHFVQLLRESPEERIARQSVENAEDNIRLAESSGDDQAIAVASLSLAVAHHMKKDYVKAIEATEKGLTIASDKTRAKLLYQLALAKSLSGDTEGAKEIFEEFASGKWGINQADALYFLGELAVSKNDWARAEAHFERALAIAEPDNRFVLSGAGYGLSYCLLRRADLAGAIAALEAAEKAGDPAMAKGIASMLSRLRAKVAQSAITSHERSPKSKAENNFR